MTGISFNPARRARIRRGLTPFHFDDEETDMNISAAVNTSPLTNKTLWTYTGGILVRQIVGRVSTVIETATTNCKLSAKNDALTAVDLCINADLTADAVGTVLSLPAAVGSALVETTLGALLNLLAQPIILIPSTSGIITVTFGANSTGAIDWYLHWQPAVAGATVQAG
jgi:hypothetical protein